MKKVSIFTYGPYLNDKLFDLSDPILNRDNCLLPYHELKFSLKARGLDSVSYTHLTLPTNREV